MEKKLFWFHVFSLNSSNSQAEWLLLSFELRGAMEPISTSLGKCLRAPLGGDQDRGLGHSAITSPRL